ncbi:MAG: polysaccharide deacetylase family protein [Casimicrobiaceae bacterium]
MGALTTALGWASPAGRQGRLSILIFHRVLPAPDPLFPGEPDAQRFDRILGWVKSWFNVLPLDEAARRLAAGTLPRRAAAITFDDGYADNCLVALPILQSHGVAATFFVATGYLDGGIMWNDRIIAAVRGCARPVLDLESLELGIHPISSTEERRQALDGLIGKTKYLDGAGRDETAVRIAELAGVETPSDLMLTTAQLRVLHVAGMRIGAHTVTHPILARLPQEEARREMAQSRQALEDALGAPIELFAYPNGKPGIDYLPEHAQMAREIGFKAAVSTGRGAAGPGTDAMQLPRFTPWDRTRMEFGARMLGNILRRTPPG